MKSFYIFSVLLFSVGVALADDVEEEEGTILTLADVCDPEACKLPSCKCSNTEIPGGLAPRDTPQFVLVTFDDNINRINIETYRSKLYNRYNANGCKTGTTFFINHEYSDYQLINELYNQGYEIALHSVSHRTNQTYWAAASYEDMAREFGDQKTLISHFANIPITEIKGIRHPFLQMTGNASYQVIADYGLEYDSSWGTVNNINPGMWPYSLDYLSTQECMIGPCPTASLPGVWIKPLVGWLDLNGTPCTMVDSCFAVPNLNDGDAWFDFIVKNFERQYLGNRSPFGFYIHEWYVASNPGVSEGLTRFLDLITKLSDVFVVNAHEVINWTKNPIPVNEYASKPCRTFPQTGCPASSCGPLYRQDSMEGYWMSICNSCPVTYPWIGNPLGL